MKRTKNKEFVHGKGNQIKDNGYIYSGMGSISRYLEMGAIFHQQTWNAWQV